jgi:hypothetical protein
MALKRSRRTAVINLRVVGRLVVGKKRLAPKFGVVVNLQQDLAVPVRQIGCLYRIHF